MIASHYAEPVERKLRVSTELRASPSANSEKLDQLEPGARFVMLDESLGWAWGYAGSDNRVGYVPGDTLASQ